MRSCRSWLASEGALTFTIYIYISIYIYGDWIGAFAGKPAPTGLGGVREIVVTVRPPSLASQLLQGSVCVRESS